MVQTALFKEILQRANQVKEEFSAEHLTAAHIAVAVADFCAVRYTGHTPIALQSSVRFEEERLRYLFSKEVKVASYLRKKLTALNANIQIKATRNAGYSLEEIL